VAKYLLEIGTEELPYKFIPSALKQIEESFSDALRENRLEFSGIKIYGTPRRLCVIIDNVSESQPDLVKEIKGPPAQIAFGENGELTKAGVGFANKMGLKTQDLTKKNIDGIEYLYAEIKEQGKNSNKVLQKFVPELILKLQGPHFMRWADLDVKFSRPIRWIVSVMDGKEVKIKIGDVESGLESIGHRFCHKNKVWIHNPDNYLDDLMSVKVIADPVKRKKEIEKQINDAAISQGGKAKIDLNLLEEVNNLVEWPTGIVGNFDPKYLEITKEVIVTVLAHHQRYFPVYKQDGSLLNYFITIANHSEPYIENIKKGNEKVVKARLDDAIFFYKEDTKKSLESKVEALKGVTFQKGLGTVYDKVTRICKISDFIATELGLDDEIKDKIMRTAWLCKADLVTNLVREFTELQGLIGGDYAKLDGEDFLVCEGIKEHYMPVSSDGELAEHITGQIVSFADKFDTIAGVFSLGKAPTGSADPLGLRRATLGIINTIIHKNINVNISKAIDYALSIQPVKPENTEKITGEIYEFVNQRLKILLTEKYKYDVVDSALSVKSPLENIPDVIERINILSELVKKESYKGFHEAANRISRIIKNQLKTDFIDKALLKECQEQNLFENFKALEHFDSYQKLVQNLENLIPFIDRFFDKVLVMDENENIKNNRINLLAIIEEKFLLIGDFTKIVF
jgi:glycyl-tRNA synthetase beta chain